jgi:peptide/nickel transport system permease protein
MEQDRSLVTTVPWVARPVPGISLGGVWGLARRKPLGACGALIVLALILLALAAPVLAPYDYREQNRADLLKPPSAAHLLGTDNLGRDIFSRLLYGAQTTLYVALVAVGLGTTAGSIIGLVSGYAGGHVDLILQRLMDMLMAFPTLILAIATVAVLGPTTTNVVVAMAIVFTPTANRVVRGSVLAEKENQYVEAARAMGAGGARIVFRHVLPNVMAPIIVIVSTSLGTAILVESSLSFLGLGPPPPTPTWGAMLSVGSRTFFERAPWMAIAPGIAISLTILGFNLLGDALRDILDPRLQGGRR